MQMKTWQNKWREFWSLLPIPYVYMILLGIGLGVLLGVRFYLTFWMSGEINNWTFENYFIPPFTNQTLWGFLAPVVYFVLINYPVRQDAPFRVWARGILISILVALFHEVMSYLVWWIPYHITGYEKISMQIIRSALVRMPAGFVGQWVEFWVLYLLFAGIDYSRKYKAKQLELVRIEAQRNQSQLDALRLQLQPHFLFNTLNTISALVEVDPKAAQGIIRRLGDLLRGLLATQKAHMTTVSGEMEFVSNYLDIEQMRFNDRLAVRYQVEPELTQVPVPAFILQPLVENAIKHGFSGQSGPCSIQVKVNPCDTDKICLEVRDDGKGTSLPVDELLTKGIGLRNVKERLELIYGDAARLDVQLNKDKGFAVIIVIPRTQKS